MYKAFKIKRAIFLNQCAYMTENEYESINVSCFKSKLNIHERYKRRSRSRPF